MSNIKILIIMKFYIGLIVILILNANQKLSSCLIQYYHHYHKVNRRNLIRQD
jgi:hypothetical protein